jgi:hypothetical protein
MISFKSNFQCLIKDISSIVSNSSFVEIPNQEKSSEIPFSLKNVVKESFS